MNKPLVSVVMPVYNRETFLAEAIQSILAQTYTNFEFIIVDDGSTDRSIEVIQNYRDPRIRLIQLPKNQGISAARNAGNKLAQGEFIAAMDSDDIALPRRLERQIKYMHSHPDIGICGASVVGVDEKKRAVPKPNHEFLAVTNSKQAKVRLLLGMPFAHPTFFVRRWIYQAIPYELRWIVAADYGFLVEASRLTSLGGLNEKLMLLRKHPEQVSQLQTERQMEHALQISMTILMRLGISLDQKDRETWLLFRRPPPQPLSTEELQAVDELGARIAAANLRTAEFDGIDLQTLLSRQWWHLCRRASRQGRAITALYSDSKLKWRGPLSAFYGFRMATLCLGIGREISLVRWLEKFRMHL